MSTIGGILLAASLLVGHLGPELHGDEQGGSGIVIKSIPDKGPVDFFKDSFCGVSGKSFHAKGSDRSDQPDPVPTSANPEPSSAVLAGLGVAGLLGMYLRRRL